LNVHGAASRGRATIERESGRGGADGISISSCTGMSPAVGVCATRDDWHAGSDFELPWGRKEGEDVPWGPHVTST